MAEQIIEGRVIQKVATADEWAAGTLPLKKGEFAIVSDSTGKPINIRVGDGTNPFSGLVDMFDAIQQNVNFIEYSGGAALPTPTIDTGYTILSEGSYTFGGSPAFTVPAGHWGTANWDGNSWSFTDLGQIKGDRGQDGASLLAPWTAGSYPLNAEVRKVINGKNVTFVNDVAGNTNDPETLNGWSRVYVETPVINNRNSVSTSDALAVNEARILDSYNIVNSLKLQSLNVPSFKDMMISVAPLTTTNQNKYLFAPLSFLKNNIFGFRKDNYETIKIPFTRSSRAVGIADNNTFYEATKDEPIANKYDASFKLSVTEPFRENLGVDFNAFFFGGARIGSPQATLQEINELDPFGGNKYYRLTNIPTGTGDKAGWSREFGEVITGRRFVSSIILRAPKGTSLSINTKRAGTGGDATASTRIVNFTGEWQRVSTPVYTAVTGAVGVGLRISVGSTSVIPAYLDIYAPQIEEIQAGELHTVTSPIFLPPLSKYQLNFITSPLAGGSSSLFQSEVSYPNGFELTNSIIRNSGTQSGKFYFQQDAGSIRRSELRSREVSSPNGMWYSFSVYFPSDYAYSAGTDIFFQMRDTEDLGDIGERNPSFSLRTTNNNIEMLYRWDSRPVMTDQTSNGTTVVVKENFQRDVWYDFIVKYKTDYLGLDSILDLWIRENSDNVSDYIQITNYRNFPFGYNDRQTPRQKFGIYRFDNFVGSGVTVTNRTLYYADLKAYVIDDDIIGFNDLVTNNFQPNQLKLVREASSINTTGLTITDPVGDMGYFWAE